MKSLLVELRERERDRETETETETEKGEGTRLNSSISCSPFSSSHHHICNHVLTFNDKPVPCTIGNWKKRKQAEKLDGLDISILLVVVVVMMVC